MNTRTLTGKCSEFGGPLDVGVSRSEGLALIEPSDLHDPWFGCLFLPHQPVNTSGLARRLNPEVFYIAMRWNYNDPFNLDMPVTPREFLRRSCVTVSANGKTFATVRPVDWGPNTHTRRIADCSPGLLRALGVHTDSEITVTIPFPA